MYGFTEREARVFTRKIDHSRERKHRQMLIVVIIMVAIATFISYVLLPIILPHEAKAQQRGPMTNKEVCEDIRDGKYASLPGQMTQTVEMCSRYGIKV